MGGKFSRDKGNRTERKVVALYEDIPGVFAHRVPLSGAMKNYKGDVKVIAGAHDFTAEVKCRANGFTKLYQWLEGMPVLHVVQDREEPLTVLPWWYWRCILEKLAKEQCYALETVDTKNKG